MIEKTKQIRTLVELLEDIKSKFAGIVDFPSKKYFFENIKSQWDNDIENRFSMLIEEVGKNNYQERLEMVGLTGEHLELKIKVWEIIKENVKKWVHIVFDFINSILSSLSAVIPAFDCIKEFKDMAHIGYKIIEIENSKN